MLAMLLAAAAGLPVVIPDPRLGPSDFSLVRPGEPVEVEPAGGFLLTLPPEGTAISQAWLELLVELSARGAPVLSMGRVPPATVVPYLDGAVLDPPPKLDELAELRRRLGGIALVVPANDAATAVAGLAAGASAVLVRGPRAAWAEELTGLLEEPFAATSDGRVLPTAMRSADLATVIGMPAGFPGGEVDLPNAWYERARLVGDGTREVSIAFREGHAVIALPALPSSALLVVERPAEGVATIGLVEVRGERIPTAAEVLARHQRVAARQATVLQRWSAVQRLLVRVWVAELGRSFEVVLEGPAFFRQGVGTDWEVARAWVEGVIWDPDELPELPLLEPGRPPVPPLALRLEPSWRFELVGVEERLGRRCFALTFAASPGAAGSRRGTALIDATSFALVELEERAENLDGEVRATRQVTTFQQMEWHGETLWPPRRVVADDLISAYGGSASVHRELTLSDLAVVPERFDEELGTAYARPHRMFRDTPTGIVPLSPDGKGGRIVGENRPARQRFIIGGAVYDPGLSFPVPFGGLQISDFDFRGRGEHFRALLAGAVNDAAWSSPRGKLEPSLRAFVQLWPFSNSVWVRGEEREGEEIEVLRQRVGVAAARAFGSTRISLDFGLDRWDFRRVEGTAAGFVLPADTFEAVGRLESSSVLGATTVGIAFETGHRFDWEAWGMEGVEPPNRSWRRGELKVVHEREPFPLAKLSFSAQLLAGRDLDRFSAFSPGRFGSVRLRGIAANRVLADRLAVVRGSFALPLSRGIRGEVGADLAWARDRRSGYEAQPLAGVALGLSTPGPWRTLLEVSLGYPISTPGDRAPTFELFLLRPL